MARMNEARRRDGDALGRRARARVLRRRLGVVALSAAVLALVVVIVGVPGGASGYTIHARFQNAGQLVKGGLVEVGGVKIGQIEKVSLAENGEADIELGITDDAFNPLREGTRATIRSVGQATITNRYVDLVPGPSNHPALSDGATIDTTHTAGIVDLDAIFASVDGPARAQLRGLIRNSAQIYAGSASRTFNEMLGRLDPALKQAGGLLQELAADKDDIARLIRTGERASTAIASRRPDLEAGIVSTARMFSAIATERGALGDSLRRAPAVLRQARHTLRSTGKTVTALRPALAEVAPVQPDLRRVLGRLPPALDAANPALTSLASLARGPLATAVEGFTPLAPKATDAFRNTTEALKDARPIVSATRQYGADLLLGVVNGLFSLITGGYDAQGHFAKISFVQSPQTALNGLLSPLLPAVTGDAGLIPGVINTKTKLTNRCPGSNAPPAADGSSPWILDRSLCDPAQSMSALVNSPTAYCRTAFDCEERPGAGESEADRKARARSDDR